VNRNHQRAWIVAFALVGLGCGTSWSPARLTQPVSMSPMANATLSVEAGGIYVTDDLISAGMNEDTALAVELGITNAGSVPYALNAAAISCWMELSPEQPGETRSLTPAAGGEGPFPTDLAGQDYALGSITVPPGQTRKAWVMFRGYRYEGSDVPRKITVSLPDPSGRHVQVVIADPARGQLRWEAAPPAVAFAYGVQNSTLYASGFSANATSAQLSAVSRAGPFLYDVGLTTLMLLESKGLLPSETSGFSGLGVNAHLTYPFFRWGSWQNPRLLGFYGGGEAHYLAEILHEITTASKARVFGTLSGEGGLELDFGAQAPAASPFPISFTGRGLPRWGIRLGYTHWFVFGNSNGPGVNSGGLTTAVRFRF
jgi:hypothetical protein